MTRRLAVVICGLAFLGLISARRMCADEQDKAEQAPVKHRVTLVTKLGHWRLISAVAFSPDGKQVLTGSADWTARLWDAASGQEIRTFQGHSGEVTSVAFSPDGKQVLTGSADWTARLWDAASAKVIRGFQGHRDWVTSVAFSPDSKQVLTASFDKTARLWDAASAKEIRSFQGHTGEVASVAFSPDGKQLLTGSFDKTARLWDAANAKEIRSFQGHTGVVTSVAFSPDGKQLLTGSRDKTARLWDAASAKEIRGFEHTDLVNSVAFSPDGKQVLTGSADKTARLWGASNGHEIHTFKGHFAVLAAVAFSLDGKQVLTGSADSTARLWDAASAKEVRKFQGHYGALKSVAFSPNGRQVLTGGWDMTAQLWDASSGKQIRGFQGHTNEVTSVAFSPDGKQVLTGSADWTASLWNAASGKEIRRFLGHTQLVESVAFSPDGKQVLTGSADKTARLWNAADGKQIHIFQRHTSAVTAVAFSPDGEQVLTGGADKTARLWVAAVASEIRAFEGHAGPIEAVAFSPDGKQVLTGGWDRTARLWDASTGKEIRGFLGHTNSVTSVAFSSDGKQVLTGSADRTARLWNASTGKEIRSFQGHSKSVESVAFSPDAKQVLTGSWDTTARVWNAASGSELCRLLSFGDGTWAVIDADGRYDASHGGDVDGLYWVAGDEPLALKQLKDRYYEPGLLGKHMGFNHKPLRQVEAFKEVELFPEAKVEKLDSASGNLTLHLTNRGGGLGKVQVFVNGRELLADARGPKYDAQAADATLPPIDLSAAPTMLPGEANRVTIVTWNAAGYLSSRGLDLSWDAPAAKKKQAVELYALITGVSNYAGEQLHLNFAAKDAQDMYLALTTAAKRLFDADRVHITLLSDADHPAAKAPTRENLVHAFEALRKTRPTDVVVIYLAGHGIAIQDKNGELYCYLTNEARSTDRAALLNEKLREQTALNSAELTEWLKKIPALKQVLILDTCAAGAAASKLMEHRDIDADAIRVIDRMHDRIGFHVLMGCAADKVSYEASRFRQGLLTHALLKGMRGAALDFDLVDVPKLFLYAEDEVPQLAAGIGGIQQPLALSTPGNKFPVGRLLAEDKKLIPLASVHKLLLKPLLLNADKNILHDDLALVMLLRTKLRAYNSQAQGKIHLQPVFVYVDADADEMPETIRPSGTYTVQGKQVRVWLNLSRDGLTLAKLEVEGTRDDLAGLAARLAAAIEEKLKMP